jgi:hypothetical protein
MEDPTELERLERERLTLLEEAIGIVFAAEARARLLTSEEDTQVLELVTRARSLEQQIRHLQRRKKRSRSQKTSGGK